MPSRKTRVVVVALALAAAPLWARPALAGPPGSPGYCPGDGLMHDWDTGKPMAPCPIGGGLVSTPKGNVWVDRNGNTHVAPSAPQGNLSRGPYPNEYSSDGDGEPNPRPVPVQPGAGPPTASGNAGVAGGPP